MFFVEEKQTESRVFGSNFYLCMAGRRKSSRQRGSSFSEMITRSRAGKATILLLVQEIDRQNARPSKVLTTERLLSFQRRLRKNCGSFPVSCKAICLGYQWKHEMFSSSAIQNQIQRAQKAYFQFGRIYICFSGQTEPCIILLYSRDMCCTHPSLWDGRLGSVI